MHFLYKLLIIGLLDFLLPSLLNVYDVPQSYYMNYLVLINVVFFFNLILSSKVGEMFT
jgi:hypothetical protein